jgi:hypothetical protein
LDKVPEGAMVMVSAWLTRRSRLSRRHDLAGKTKGRAEPSTCALLCGPDAVADYEAELSGRSGRSASLKSLLCCVSHSRRGEERDTVIGTNRELPAGADPSDAR